MKPNIHTFLNRTLSQAEQMKAFLVLKKHNAKKAYKLISIN